MFGHDDNNKQDSDLAPLADQPTVHPDPQPDGVLDDNAATTPSQPSNGLPFTPPNPVSTTPADDHTSDAPAPPNNSADDLLSMKQQALQQLSPLVSHLEQTPEEKFRTTMMMIQASDDESLVKAAFEAAKEIKDNKERAQALLDVINEINYFTQPQDNES